MKRISYLFIVILVLAGCGSSKKQMQRGNYDAAIDKSVKKLLKDPESEDDIVVLERSYQIANERDLERIKFLKMDGNPNSWEEIMNIYLRLKDRQTQVRTVLPLQLNNRTINYEYVDYDSEIIEAKHKAAEYFFAHGQKLLESNTKEANRQAHYEFLKVKQY